MVLPPSSDGDPARQRGDAHVLVEKILRFVRLTDLEDQPFTGELNALFRHGLFEVVNPHDAKLIGLDGSLRGNGGLTATSQADRPTTLYEPFMMF